MNLSKPVSVDFICFCAYVVQKSQTVLPLWFFLSHSSKFSPLLFVIAELLKQGKICLLVFILFSSWDALSGISKQRKTFGVKLLLARVGVIISNSCGNSIRDIIIHNDEDVSICQQFAWDTNIHTCPLIEMSDLSFCIQEKVVDFILWQCQNTSTTDLYNLCFFTPLSLFFPELNSCKIFSSQYKLTGLPSPLTSKDFVCEGEVFKNNSRYGRTACILSIE